MSGESKYKLIYFNLRGRAEIARELFLLAGVEFEDSRIEWDDKEKWTPLKEKTPFGQLPVLEYDGGKVLCQSYAISRLLANRFGYAGKTDVEKAEADMIADCMLDITNPIEAIFEEQNEERKKEMTKVFAEKLPKFLTMLEKLLKANNNGEGFFVGESLTWADLAYINSWPWFEYVKLESVVDEFPLLSALKKRVDSIPQIADWIAKRPKTWF